MKNLRSLSIVDGAELMRLARTGVITEADGLRREVSKALAALHPAAIVALALSIAPDESAAVALQRFKNMTTELLALLSVSGEKAEAAQRAEQHRLAGAVATAAHRTLEIAAAMTHIESRVRFGEAAHHGKRARLRNEGLSGAELDKAAAPFDPSELHAQRAALLAEQDTLEIFLRTRDPQHLPAGIAREVNEAT